MDTWKQKPAARPVDTAATTATSNAAAADKFKCRLCGTGLQTQGVVSTRAAAAIRLQQGDTTTTNIEEKNAHRGQRNSSQRVKLARNTPVNLISSPRLLLRRP